MITVPKCDGCAKLKALLAERGLEFAEADLRDGAAITELRMAGCHDKVDALRAPILMAGGRVWKYDQLFGEGGALDEAAVKAATKKGW
jgi:glutaredoxin